MPHSSNLHFCKTSILSVARKHVLSGSCFPSFGMPHLLTIIEEHTLPFIEWHVSPYALVHRPLGTFKSVCFFNCPRTKEFNFAWECVYVPCKGASRSLLPSFIMTCVHCVCVCLCPCVCVSLCVYIHQRRTAPGIGHKGFLLPIYKPFL